MFLSFSIDIYVIFLYWNISMNYIQFIFIGHLLMLTYFCVENVLKFQYCCWLFTDFDYLSCANVLIILDWCFCDFLVLKHINELDTCHLHRSFTDFDIFSCGKCSRISILLLIIYWCWLFFMCKMFVSISIDVYVIFLYWNISMNYTHSIFIGHLLMLTYFHVENVPEFQYCFWLFTDVNYFSRAKCSYHSWLMFMWFSCTETYRWIAHTSSSLVFYWCWHIFMWKMFHPFWISFLLGLICVFSSIVFSVGNILVLGAFGCFSFVINLCELLLPFSCELFQYCF